MRCKVRYELLTDIANILLCELSGSRSKPPDLEDSMSGRGNCHDNAVAERLFKLLKRERIKKKIYGTWEEARSDIFDYIEMFYNSK